MRKEIEGLTSVEYKNGFEIYNTGDFKAHIIRVPYELPENAELSNYLNLEIKAIEKETFIRMNETEYSLDIFNTISSKVNENNSLLKVLDDVSELYLKYKTKYLKFRGDLAEAIFLYKVGGQAIVDGETFDIKLDEKHIEVKSFSRQRKTIHISFEQLMQTSVKYAVPIIPDHNGMSIIELANTISNNNPEFSKSLIDKYEKDQKISSTKYEITIPIDISEQLKDIFNNNNKVLRAELEIYIEIN